MSFLKNIVKKMYAAYFTRLYLMKDTKRSETQYVSEFCFVKEENKENNVMTAKNIIKWMEYIKELYFLWF